MVLVYSTVRDRILHGILVSKIRVSNKTSGSVDSGDNTILLHKGPTRPSCPDARMKAGSHSSPSVESPSFSFSSSKDAKSSSPDFPTFLGTMEYCKWRPVCQALSLFAMEAIYAYYQ